MKVSPSQLSESQVPKGSRRKIAKQVLSLLVIHVPGALCLVGAGGAPKAGACRPRRVLNAVPAGSILIRQAKGTQSMAIRNVPPRQRCPRASKVVVG